MIEKHQENFHLPLIVGECALSSRMRNEHYAMKSEELCESDLPPGLVRHILENTEGNFPPPLHGGGDILKFIEDRETGIESRPVADPETDTLSNMASRAVADLIGQLHTQGVDISGDPLMMSVVTSSCKSTEGIAPFHTDYFALNDLAYAVADEASLLLTGERNRIRHILSLDQACAGFLAVVDETRKKLEALPEVRHAIVVATEMLTQHTDWRDPLSFFLFRDGAYAMLLTREQIKHVTSLQLLGSLHEHDPSAEAVASLYFDRGMIRLDGKKVFKAACQNMGNAVIELAREFGLQLADVAHAWFHQANARIVSSIRDKLHKICATLHVPIKMQQGNGGTLTLPSLILDLIRSGEIGMLRNGQRVMLSSFGMGTHNRAILGQVT